VQVARRLGFDGPDVALLGAMVAHHLLLPHTATRRDLDDPATVTRVVETLAGTEGARQSDGGGRLLLDLLEALAEADSLATGPGVWSAWKRRLLGDLARRCRAVLAGERPHTTPSEPAVRELAAAVKAGGGPQVRLTCRDPATFVVVVPDHAAVLSAAAGVLALHSLEVHAAELDTEGRASVGRFTVTPRFGGLPDPKLLRADLARCLDGSLALADALARKERDYAPVLPPGETPAPPRVLWFDDEATGGVVLELRATDRIGMLHRVAAALEGCGGHIRWARVATLGSAVVDSFGLACPLDGDATPPAAGRREIERAVLAAAR
jgi:[protein-PII] uridylyltransferase